MTITPREWIREPEGEELDGVLKADLSAGGVSFPIAIDTAGIAKETFIMDSEQEYTIIFEATPEIRVFEDEVAFYNRGDIGLPADFEAETFLPVGLYPPDYIEFDISTEAVVSGKVIDVCENPEEFGFSNDGILAMISCRGYEFQISINKAATNINNLEVGNIIAGGFWIHGWPVSYKVS